MLKRLIIYMSLGLFMWSCYTVNKPKKPKNLISKSKMVDVLMDIKLLSSANGKNKKTLENNNIYPETYIYKKHNIDSLQFVLSNNYYAYYVEDYEAIYTKIKDSFDALKNKYKALEAIEVKKKKEEDSLRLIRKNDSLKLIKVADSIKSLTKKDTLTAPLLKKKIEKGRLVKPVSKIDSPRQ